MPNLEKQRSHLPLTDDFQVKNGDSSMFTTTKEIVSQNGHVVNSQCAPEAFCKLATGVKIEQLRENVPTELKALPQWVVWRAEPNPDPSKKPIKKPYQPNKPVYGASTTDPNHWTTFDKAIFVMYEHDFTGIGFVFTEDDPYIGLDVDHLVDDDTRWYWANRADTYIERSQSGDGFHIIVRGQLPKYLSEKQGAKSGDQEAYAAKRYFVFTGDVIGEHRQVNDDQQLIEDFCDEYLKPKEQPKRAVRTGTQPASAQPAVLSDEEVISAIDRSSDNKAKALIRGDLAGAGFNEAQHSEASFSLCSKLAFWTGRNESQMLRLALQSGVNPRRDWERILTNYDIPKAIQNCVEVYTPKREVLQRQWVVSGELSELEQEFLKFGSDDDGNAQSVMAAYGDEILFTESHGWMIWTGTHWREKADESIKTLVIDTLKRRRMAAVKTSNEMIVKCSKPNASTIKACLYVLQSLAHSGIERFDADSDKLNCANGVVNLRTKEIEPHHPGQRFTYCIKTAYKPDADVSLWVKFLNDALGSQEVVDYLQAALGYSVTGDTREECMFYVEGKTRSGKGTFSETILRLLDKPLGVGAEFKTFTASRDGDTQNFDLAQLKPARFIVASESKRHENLNDAKIKSLTGGDYIRCAHKHREHFEYRPQFKIWLLSNWPLKGDVDDDAFWARVRLFKFENSWLGKEDKTLKYRLLEESSLEGVLSWIVDGAARWYREGLITPKQISDNLDTTRGSLDHIQHWIEESCEVIEEGWCANNMLYASYERWCAENGVTPKHSVEFSRSLTKKGFQTGVQRRVGGVNNRGVSGLQIVGVRKVHVSMSKL